MSTVATSLLPAEIRPVKYQVSLSPNLTAFTFAGEEIIEIEVHQPTSQIVLNAAELEIQEAFYGMANGLQRRRWRSMLSRKRRH